MVRSEKKKGTVNVEWINCGMYRREEREQSWEGVKDGFSV